MQLKPEIIVLKIVAHLQHRALKGYLTIYVFKKKNNNNNVLEV